MNKKTFDGKIQYYKILLLGGATVGKTCFLERYVDGNFHPNHMCTIGMEYKLKDLKLDNGEIIKLQIWDTPGQERIISLISYYIKVTHCFILLYNITDKETLKFLRYVMKKIKEEASENAIIIVAGNFADDETNRKITKEEGENFAKEFNLPFFECSGKENKNINEIFNFLGKKLYETFEGPKIKLENKKIKK